LELDNFLSHFVESIDGWINVVLFGGPDRFIVRRVLAGCDATWWAEIIVRVQPDRAHDHISDLFKHVHGDVSTYSQCRAPLMLISASIPHSARATPSVMMDAR
jgi:hypothetical protein